MKNVQRNFPKRWSRNESKTRPTKVAVWKKWILKYNSICLPCSRVLSDSQSFLPQACARKRYSYLRYLPSRFSSLFILVAYTFCGLSGCAFRPPYFGSSLQGHWFKGTPTPLMGILASASLGLQWPGKSFTHSSILPTGIRHLRIRFQISKAPRDLTKPKLLLWMWKKKKSSQWNLESEI